MKILIVNTSDIEGGAARAAYRLHKSLLKAEINSTMLVQSKKSDDWTVVSTKSKVKKLINLIRPTADQILTKFYKNKSKTLFSPAWIGNKDIIKKIEEINPDIVHLHWVNGGMIKIEDFAKISKPIVWSLHDMWVFTGGCHYDEECDRYKNFCFSCKVLESIKKNDLSKKIFYKKKIAFSKLENITIVGLSKWLSNCAKSSTLLKNKKHINLPNAIDVGRFKSFDKIKSRELWELPKDKKLILFGAMGATSDPRKGFLELSKTIENIVSKDIELIVFGSSEPKVANCFGLKTHYVGNLYDDVSLVTLYSAVDVMVVPSLQENLSNAIMESLSCATPVVGFDIGGNSDMIEHKDNGYLAEPFNSDDLAYGIEWVLDNKNYDKLCLRARQKVLNEFSSEVVVQKYIKLYKDILDDI